MNEDPPIRVPQILEQGLLLQEQQQQPFTCSGNNMLQMAVAPLSMLSSNSLEERALFLYNQPLNTPFFKSPCSPDFPIVVNSALIPGLKGRYQSLPFVCSFCYGWMLCYYYMPFFIFLFMKFNSSSLSVLNVLPWSLWSYIETTKLIYTFSSIRKKWFDESKNVGWFILWPMAIFEFVILLLP